MANYNRVTTIKVPSKYPSSSVAGSSYQIKTGFPGNHVLPTEYNRVKSKFTHTYSRVLEERRYGEYITLSDDYGGNSSFTSVSDEFSIGNFTVTNGTAPGAIADLHSEAMNKSFKSLQRNRYQLGTELAEVFKTARTLSQVTIEALRLLSDFKKSLTSKRARARLNRRFQNIDSDSLSAAYLSVRMGLRPMAYLAQDVAQLHKEKLTRDLYFYGRGRTRFNGKGPSGLSIRQQVSAYHYYRVEDPELFARAQLGLSLHNAPQMLWELTPWSWVVDYIFPVGDYIAYLAQRNLNDGSQFQIGSVSAKTTYHYYEYENLKSGDGTRFRTTTVNTKKASGVCYYRTLLHDQPKPSCQVKIDDLNPLQILDLMAALRSKF